MKVKEKFILLIGLVKDFLKGRYKDVKKSSLAYILMAFLYLIFPIDLIPDYLFGIGFLDDIALIWFIFHKINFELEKYKKWKDILNKKVVIDTTGSFIND